MKISSLHKDNYEFIEASNLPTVNVNSKTADAVIMPSKAAMVNFILKNIEGDDLAGIVSESIPKVQRVASYEKLGAVFGQKINSEVMLAVNPQSKGSKYLYAVSFTNLIYSLTCMTDIAKAKAHSALAKLDPKDLMYVNEITFGRAASIFIESDADYETMKNLVDRKYFKRKLMEEDEAILANSTIHFQISDTKEVDLFDGDPFQIIRSYMTAPITKEDFLRPIWISGINLNDGDMVITP
ncbi:MULTISPECIES: hypothetical protein [unclassified Sphingobacterium]|uniref:hypothetical protein n=1 Tax=unclassified Sphingobacterium TaxID=2609468 RepID=UPI0025E46B73|nr:MULTISPECIES: hypothetical protein [unclassified Sphingobacterium]